MTDQHGLVRGSHTLYTTLEPREAQLYNFSVPPPYSVSVLPPGGGAARSCLPGHSCPGVAAQGSAR